MERINIFYHGQEIASEDRASIKAQLAYHLGDGPSDASICCCISNEPEGLACNVKIHSQKGHVSIHRESNNLVALMNYVFHSMKDAFQKWHRDPDHFAKSHPLTKAPCKGASHKNLRCPVQSFSQ